jgi:putative membrane-bound dehydrogenase-like protein
MLRRLCFAASIVVALLLTGDRGPNAQGPKKEVIPHGQSEPPGPPLSPAEAIKKMRVPPGFHVELVAAEPDLVNPVAMTFDEKGRIWITESLEYPRHSAGPGKDRVKVFESTKGDGKYDKITTVIEGLNIPSGIAVGHGGVWVANSPDLLFYPFADRDAPKVGKPQLVVTGFGRSDTHELPNSLTWGPDGCLYGLNGVFNPSVVKQDGKEWRFTCAMFRIHPRTKKFDLFCEGTSNPWGIAFDSEGSAFVSACVIDHLWHLVETGYYHRQGGPYPPYTWKIESIVKHRHQKAAYCGLHYFDSDTYPEEYRGKLYMGNIHGNCINADELTRDGSTYFGKPRPDFLTANDAWFMPVAQRTGPDGCLYILDWYDRYHCYQDAGRDPAGIDRLRGRLYRVTYKDFKPAGVFDVQKESNEHLLKRLGGANIYSRDIAQRVLTERCRQAIENWSPTPPPYRAFGLSAELQKLVRSDTASHAARMHALWALLGSGTMDDEMRLFLLRHKDSKLRAWGVRAASTVAAAVPLDRDIRDQLAGMVSDPSPDVKLQVAIAARKLPGVDPLPILLDVLAGCGDDKLIPHIVWQNLHPLLERDGERFLTLAAKADCSKSPGLARVLPRAIDRILGNPNGDPTAVAAFAQKLAATDATEPARLCLAALTLKIQNNEISAKAIDAFKKKMPPTLAQLAEHGKTAELRFEATLLGASLGEPDCLAAVRGGFERPDGEPGKRLRVLHALIAARDTQLPVLVRGALKDAGKMPAWSADVIQALGRIDADWVATEVVAGYPLFAPDLQPKAIELLTQRPNWAKALFGEIAARRIPREVVNVNQARRLLATKDAEMTKLVGKYWGVPRDSRNPEREKVVAQMRDLIRKTPSDAHRGIAVFKKICAQCHKIHGEGTDVGPDITANGRSDFEQLLSNVFDPSLVIGAGYQATTVVTNAGQVVTGLVVEESPQRVVLKVQGGEMKTIPRSSIDEVNVSRVSLMPEGVERQLQPQEIADLFAFLCLDRPPDDPKARKIPGTPR